MSIREWTACFNKADGSQYHWKTFKTYGGARRFIKRRGWPFMNAHDFVGWYIVRSTCVPTPWQIQGVVIAQSKNAVANHYYVHTG